MGALSKSIEKSKKRMKAVINLKELRQPRPNNSTTNHLPRMTLGSIENGIPSFMSQSIDNSSFRGTATKFVRSSDRVSFRKSVNVTDK